MVETEPIKSHLTSGFLLATHYLHLGCLVHCTREIWVTEVEEENIYWKTSNWSSEFVLQAKSGRTEV